MSRPNFLEPRPVGSFAIDDHWDAIYGFLEFGCFAERVLSLIGRG